MRSKGEVLIFRRSYKSMLNFKEDVEISNVHQNLISYADIREDRLQTNEELQAWTYMRPRFFGTDFAMRWKKKAAIGICSMMPKVGSSQELWLR